jgi:hypothetical protein
VEPGFGGAQAPLRAPVASQEGLRNRLVAEPERTGDRSEARIVQRLDQPRDGVRREALLGVGAHHQLGSHRPHGGIEGRGLSARGVAGHHDEAVGSRGQIGEAVGFGIPVHAHEQVEPARGPGAGQQVHEARPHRLRWLPGGQHDGNVLLRALVAAGLRSACGGQPDGKPGIQRPRDQQQQR